MPKPLPDRPDQGMSNSDNQPRRGMELNPRSVRRHARAWVMDNTQERDLQYLHNMMTLLADVAQQAPEAEGRLRRAAEKAPAPWLRDAILRLADDAAAGHDVHVEADRLHRQLCCTGLDE